MKRGIWLLGALLLATGCASYEGTDHEGKTPRERFVQGDIPEGMREECSTEREGMSSNRRTTNCVLVPDGTADPATGTN